MKCQLFTLFVKEEERLYPSCSLLVKERISATCSLADDDNDDSSNVADAIKESAEAIYLLERFCCRKSLSNSETYT